MHESAGHDRLGLRRPRHAAGSASRHLPWRLQCLPLAGYTISRLVLIPQDIARSTG